MGNKYLIRSDSKLQQLAFVIKKGVIQPPDHPKLGFALPCREIDRINRSLRWKTWDERFELLLAVLHAWRNAATDTQQRQELGYLFGESVAPLFGKPLLYTVAKKPRLPEREIRGWHVDRIPTVQPLVGNNLFTIRCFDQASTASVVAQLENWTQCPVQDFIEARSAVVI
jgi:hypothetical protein